MGGSAGAGSAPAPTDSAHHRSPYYTRDAANTETVLLRIPCTVFFRFDMTSLREKTHPPRMMRNFAIHSHRHHVPDWIPFTHSDPRVALFVIRKSCLSSHRNPRRMCVAPVSGTSGRIARCQNLTLALHLYTDALG